MNENPLSYVQVPVYLVLSGDNNMRISFNPTIGSGVQAYIFDGTNYGYAPFNIVPGTMYFFTLVLYSVSSTSHGIKAYLNGTPFTATLTQASTPGTVTSMQVARYSTFNAICNMSDLRIYNSPLQQDDITQIYNQNQSLPRYY